MTRRREAADVCADAVLQHIKTEDLNHNEYSAPYFDVVINSREEHIAVIAAVRRGDDNLDSEPYIESNFDAPEGSWSASFSWLGACMEVYTNGTDPAGVHFEVD